LIQRPVCLDSIIARSQRSEEFCNTFEGKADIDQPFLTDLNLCVHAQARQRTAPGGPGGLFLENDAPSEPLLYGPRYSLTPRWPLVQLDFYAQILENFVRSFRAQQRKWRGLMRK
jgi:hypothetical protein